MQSWVQTRCLCPTGPSCSLGSDGLWSAVGTTGNDDSVRYLWTYMETMFDDVSNMRPGVIKDPC